MNKEVRPSTAATVRGRLATTLALCAAVGAGSLVLSEPAAAQVDVTGITGEFTDAATAITTIGGSMLSAVGVGIAVKWILGFVL